MTCLLSVCIAALVGYFIVSAFALYFLLRFPWLNCVREVRPRHCGQHLLSYGVLLFYLVLCAMTRHGSSFFQSELRLAAAPSSSRVGTGSVFPPGNASASSIWPLRVLSDVGYSVVDAFLRPWCQFPLATAATATEPHLSAATVLLYSLLCALAQAVAATSLYGTFSVWCNARWRFSALRTVEAHADLRALLFPTDPTEAASAPGVDALRNSLQQSGGLGNSAVWGSLSPLARPSFTTPLRRAAGRHASRVSFIHPAGTAAAAVKIPARRVPGWTHGQSSAPRFSGIACNRAGAASGGILLTASRRLDDAASTAEDEQQQRRNLLRIRQRFLSSFWVRDSMVYVMTFFFFSSLAAGRVAVTIAVTSIWIQRFPTNVTLTAPAMPPRIVEWASFSPYPTEGYVAVIGLLYLALLRLRLRAKNASLRNLLVLMRGLAATKAPGASSSFSPLHHSRQRRSRFLRNANGQGSRALRSGLSRPPCFSGSPLSLQSPMSPTGPPFYPSFDAGASSGPVPSTLQGRPRSLRRATPPGSTQSSVPTLEADDHAARASGGSMASPEKCEGWSASSFARWSFRFLQPSRARSRASSPVGHSPTAAASLSIPAAAGATAAAASTANDKAAAVGVVEPNIPQFRFVLLATATLFALQMLPDSTGMWAAALLITSGCAAGTTRHALFAPLFWISTDFRRLLQCSRWTLYVSRSFGPRSMDVSKAVHGLSQQQLRHLMVLQALGNHHRRLPTTVEEDEEWVTEKADGSFAANALVEAATVAAPARLRTTALNTDPASTTATTLPPALVSASHLVETVDTASLSTSSVATAVAILGGVGDGEVSRLLTDYDAPGMATGGREGDVHHTDALNGGDSVVRAISPTQFWHGVAAKVLQKSAAQAAARQDSPYSGLEGGGTLSESFAGPASTTLTNLPAGLPPLPGIGAGAAPIPNSSFGEMAGGGDASLPNARFLGVTDPFRVAAAPPLALTSVPMASAATMNANGLMPITPSFEFGNDLLPGFRKENMKGSMLLTIPAAVRIGASAEREEEVEEGAEVERGRQAANKGKDEDDEVPKGEMKARRNEAVWSGSGCHAEARNHLEGSPSVSHSDAHWNASLSSSQQVQQEEDHPRQPRSTAPEGGWLSRALVTVVPSIGGYCSSSPFHADGGDSRRSSRTIPSSTSATSAPHSEDAEEAFTSELPPEVVHSISIASSFSTATSATARALLQSEEGFERFLSCVRRDGDNTYALQSMLSSHGHTYGRRVDGKGRSALHYAVIGGFVHGVWFLVNIGAEPNLLDKAGYAPLHYAVLYHTKHCLSPTISDENASQAAQQAQHMLGIPVVATASVQAPEQARRRRQLRQQRHRRLTQQRLKAAYRANASTTSDLSLISNSNDALPPLPCVVDQPNAPLHRRRSCSDRDSANASGELLHLLPTDTPDDSRTMIVEEGVSSTAMAAAAAMAPEERGQWYGMVGLLLKLGAEVDFPTARGLTALGFAVLQGNIGLINTLLREGANPLRGSEPDAQSSSFAADAERASPESTVACKEEGEAKRAEAEEWDGTLAWIRGVDMEFQHIGGWRRQKDDQQHPLQTSTDPGDEREAPCRAHESGSAEGKLVAASPPSSPPPPPHSAPVSRVSSSPNFQETTRTPLNALLAKRTAWVDVHITNVGSPIIMGYCKTPLLLAVELDADLAVASMLHHATLQAHSARVAAGLPAAKGINSSGSYSGDRKGAEYRSGNPNGSSGLLPTLSASDVLLSGSPMPKRPAHDNLVAPAVLADSTGGAHQLQQSPLNLSSMFPLPAAVVGTSPGKTASKDLSSTVAYFSSATPSTIQRTAHPLMDSNAGDARRPRSLADVAALLPLRIDNPAVESSSNSSVADLLPSVTVAATNTIAMAATTLESAWVRTYLERSLVHVFNAIHVALVLGNAQATRVLLLHWTYDGTARGGGHDTGGATAPSAGSKVSSRGGSGPASSAATTTLLTPSFSPFPASMPSSLAAIEQDAGSATVLGCDEALQPTVAQITVPVHDEGQIAGFLKSGFSSSSDGAAAEQASGSPPAASGEREQQAQLSAPHDPHHHQHHHGLASAAAGAGDPATATLSLTTAIGTSAFWVVPLRLNFFHLAAIGNSIECLAYVLRWRGVPDYIPCVLDEAPHSAAKAEESTRDSNAVRAQTAAQGNYHRRRTHRRPQKRLGNCHNTWKQTDFTSARCFSTASPVMTEEALRPPASTTDVGQVVNPEVDPLSTASDNAFLCEVSGMGNAVNASAGRNFLETLSSSSTIVSGTRTGDTAAAVPVQRTAGSEVCSPAPAAGVGVAAFPASTSCASLTSSTNAAEFTGMHDADAAASPSVISDVFDWTWSSSRPSLDTASLSTTRRLASTLPQSAHPSTSSRARRLRSKQRTFMRALVALLQTNIRGDAVQRRMRTTVFGRGGADALLRYSTESTAQAALGEDTAMVGLEPSTSARNTDAAAAVSAMLSADQSSVMSKTCFGSTAAAAALHTGMTICYATMNNLLNREPHGDVPDDGSDDDDSISSRSSGRPVDAVICNEGAQLPRKVLLPSVQNRVQKHRSQLQARTAWEQERLQHLRRQRRCAFASAVAKLRQCAVGVPIDIAHLAAVEMAVDRACAALPTAKARRSLQQALLIVTRRLQNQNRCRQLMDGLRGNAPAAGVEAPSAADTRRRWVTQGTRRGSEAEGTATTECSFSTVMTTTSTSDSRQMPSSCNTPQVDTTMRTRRRGSSVQVSVDKARSGSQQCLRSPSMATSAPSYYSTFDSYTAGQSYGAGEESDADSASVESHRRLQQQQRLLQLLRALATELNAVDTCGLTPLHYAIANRNASMVYLLCAYGATFAFASEETEKLLVGHPVEVVAAAAAVAQERNSTSHLPTTSPATTAREAHGARASSIRNGDGGDAQTALPVTLPTSTVAPPSGLATMRSEKPGNSTLRQKAGPHQLSLSTTLSSSRLSAAMPAAASPGGLDAVRTQLASPSISAATDLLSHYSEHFFTQLTPATQAALRKASKAGSAEFLLRQLHTLEEPEMERPRLEGGAAAATGITPAEMPPSPDSSHSSFPASQKLQQVSSLKQSFAQPTTMAARLTEALSIGANSSFALAAAGAASIVSAVGKEAREAGQATTPTSFTETPLTTTAVLTSSASSPEAELMAGREGSCQGLQAQLTDQEDRALQRMVGGACEEPSTNSISIPLPSPAKRVGERDGVEGHNNGNGAASPSTAATAFVTASNSPATAAAAAAVEAQATHEAAHGVEYALLEPHDMFLIHMVRNPTTANSVVRAAMEGTALRYLFQASVTSSPVDI